jgi:hypothetical protein
MQWPDQSVRSPRITGRSGRAFERVRRFDRASSPSRCPLRPGDLARRRPRETDELITAIRLVLRAELEALRAIEREAGRAFAAIGMAEIAAAEPLAVVDLEVYRAAGSPSMRGIDQLRACSAASSMAARTSSR